MMQWALTAVAVLFLFLTVRTVFQSARSEGGERKKLGRGFVVATILLWVYVLRSWSIDPWPAIRIGVAIGFLMPVVEAIARPQGASYLRAGLCLFFAILIAGPAVRSAWIGFGPDLRPQEERELTELIEELEAARADLVVRRDALAKRRDELRAEIYRPGTTFADIEADPDRLADLRVLVSFDEAFEATQADLNQIDARLPHLREALASATTPEDEGEVGALLRALETAPSLEDLSLVEREAQKMELEAYFEENEPEG